jgi:hypothetical protein
MSKHKKSYYLDKVEQLEKPLKEHLRKLEEAKKAGGYTSSIEKEIHAWRLRKDKLAGRT